MILKLKDIKGLLDGLKTLENAKVPRKMGSPIVRNIISLETEQKELEKQQIEICESYATKGSDGKALFERIEDGISYVFPGKEERRKCNEEYREVLENEVDIPIQLIDEDAFAVCDDLDKYDTLTIKEQKALDFMIKK